MIGEVYFSKEKQKNTEHYHDGHQILLIRKGEIEAWINGKKHRAEKGDLILFSRLENHFVTPISLEYERYVLRLLPEKGAEKSAVYALISNRPEGFFGILRTGNREEGFVRIFDAMIRECKEREAMSSAMEKLLTEELMIAVYRLVPEQYRFLEEEKFSVVYEIQKRFEEECSRSYSLESLAKEYGVSTSSLSHWFKKIAGVSVMEYLLSCRMALAKQFLIESSLTVGEIIERCGFSDGSNFGRIFKKKNGMAPGAFRKRYRK